MLDLREKRAELILQQLDDLPTLPAVAVRVLQVTQDDKSSSADVVRLIESDPSLTTRILKLVHRADLGVRGEVNSVDRAVKLLGFDAVRSAVLAVSVFDTFRTSPSGGASKFSREDFWKHCVAVACCAELIAIELKRVHGRDAGADASDAFVCGLLHDLGKVALDAALPKSFSRVVDAAELLRGNIADVERQVIGLDHMVVGKRLAERWGLPASIRETIWLHGHAPTALPGTVQHPQLVNVVTLADVVVREMHLGWSGNYTFTPTRQALLDAIGLTSEQVIGAVAELVKHIEPRAATLGLGQSSANDIYVSALAQANVELGRVNQQLTAKSRKLAVRASFFDALNRFQAELRPDAPPQVIMHAIGQTAASVLHAGTVAVFSLAPGREYAEVALVDGNGDLLESTIAEAGHVQPTVGAGEGAGVGVDAPPAAPNAPVQPCDAAMEWLLESVSPRLAGEHRYWLALHADGRCIGGIVWGADIGEGQRLTPQYAELTALSGGWSLALRTTQIREEARTLAEQLAEANRRLQSAQTELLRSKTVVMVAEMAAGAAHEMNNPLMVISGRSKMLEQELTDPKQKQLAAKIFDNSQRLSGIITELMDFAKPEAARPAAVPINTVLEQAITIAKQTEIRTDTTLTSSLGQTPAVQVDPGQTSAAMAELIVNAVQSLPETGGKVEMNAAFDPFSQKVVLTIADNGCGMDEQTLKHAFDPFFSFKKAGRRRGLGLSKALRWIEFNGGAIRLESRPGVGTRAIVLLPAAVADSSQSGDALQGPETRAESA
ncbi:MAG TPA: HDOD domain-containing protein [Tepidisphaeraceae bacterium]|nr:HDOD domain-containing protein [Tepidisphaeraceae bacterium]